MSHTELTETQIQNLLEAITNTVIAGQNEFEPIIRRYGVEMDDISEYAQVIRSVHTTLSSSHPDEDFIRELKADLVGSPQQAGLSRFPMRARMAATLAALLAAILFLLRYRHSDDDLHETLEVPALQQ
jgi:type VI protein secretion system component VasF